MPNFPTTDVQFLAQMLVKTIDEDQVTLSEDARLREIAGEGYSRVTPSSMHIDPEHPEATRVTR